MSAIVAEQMRDKLRTVEQLSEQLATTEPISSVSFDTGNKVRFTLDEDWQQHTGSVMEPINAAVDLDGVEYQLTEEALLEATSLCSIPKGYAKKTPAKLIESHLNYWFRTGLMDSRGDSKPYKMLAAHPGGGRIGHAFTRGSVTPFSNLSLLDQALGALHDNYGVNPDEVMVDYKGHHSLRSTKFRLILPEVARQIRSARHTEETPDNWSLGLQVSNSLAGEHSTSLEGYLFAWWCTNGMLDTFNTSGSWSRRGASGNNEDDVYAWARESVDSIIGGLEGTLDYVDSLKDVPIDGDAVEVLGAVFNRYRVPTQARDTVINNMIETDDLTMYGLMQAVTMAANVDGITDGMAEAIMTAGGELPRAYGHGRVAFETAATPELLRLSGDVTILHNGQEIQARVRKLPSED